MFEGRIGGGVNKLNIKNSFGHSAYLKPMPSQRPGYLECFSLASFASAPGWTKCPSLFALIRNALTGGPETKSPETKPPALSKEIGEPLGFPIADGATKKPHPRRELRTKPRF